MRIDGHTHIFTLRTILSREGIRVMTQRLDAIGAPEWLKEAVGDLLEELLDKPQYWDERTLLKKLIGLIRAKSGFDALIENHASSDLLRVEIHRGLDDLSVDALVGILDRIGQASDGTGAGGIVMNIVQTIRQATKPTISDVARDLLRARADDGEGLSGADLVEDRVIVALMMDIYGPPDSPRDRRVYRSQITGTAEAALQFPGRVLPFFGVHPDRPGHFEELRTAVETRGFVGVKLYPSLDYEVDSDEMRRVYRYCVQADLPVLLHCGHGGFYRSDDAIDHCDPAKWDKILEHPEFKDKLRVCFAHFGGWAALGRRYIFWENWDEDNAARDPSERLEKDKNWGAKIYEYMLEYRQNVFVDLAKHVAMFEKDTHRDMYFDTLAELLADDRIGQRILFGTDAWLLRLDMPFGRYWQQWQAAAADSWEDITVHGPRRFLGFHDDGSLGGNIDNFVDHVRANRGSVGGAPAPWLAERIAEPFSPDREPAEWDFSKQAVRDTYQFLGRFLTDRQAAEGYVKNRLIRLEQLPYYDRNDPNFVGRCRDLARQFVDFADQNKTYNEGHSFGSAVDHFFDLFREGEYRLCDVALALDAIIKYPEPMA